MSTLSPANAPDFARRSLPLMVGAALLAGAGAWQLRGRDIAPTLPAAGFASLQSMPISFEPNRGQFAPDVLYLARGIAGQVSVRAGEIAITRRRGDATAGESDLRIRFSGANPAPEVESAGDVPTVSRYYLGDNGSAPKGDITHAGRVRMRALYPGIDLVLHGRQSELEYDFEVAPGADPAQVRYDLTHAEAVSVDRNGDLVIVAGGRTLRHRTPVAWQDVGDQRIPVPVRFRQDGARSVGFEVGAYDRTRALVIDPILEYSTYLGGGGNDFGGMMAVDASGMIYVVSQQVFTIGSSTSDLVAVTKYDPVSRSVVFNTYVGGGGSEGPSGVAIGGAGAGPIYVAGATSSLDFPACLNGSACTPHHGGFDAFVLALSPEGALQSSSLIGGSGDDFGNAIAAASDGFVYLTGHTSGDFPTTADALFRDPLGAPGGTDAFVVRMTPAAGVTYSTRLGGSAFDAGTAIAVDATGLIHVAGATSSANFPVIQGPAGPGAFITQFRAGGPMLASGAYGRAGDSVTGLALDPRGTGFAVTGITADPAFEQSVAPRPYAGNTDAFVMRFGADAFGTLLGGAGTDYATSISIAPNGDLFVAGATTSTDFPLIAPLPPAARGAPLAGGSEPARAFVVRYSGSSPDFATVFGGSAHDVARSVVATANGSVLVSGTTQSANFPTVQPFRATLDGLGDLFLTRIGFPTSSAALRTDFEGNRKADLLWSNTDGRAAIWLMDGTTPLNTSEIIGAGTGWSVTQLGDFNGDGKADLVWRHTDGRMAIYLMNGVAPTATQQLLNAGTGWSVIHAADLNGDGSSDLVFQHTDGSAAVWLMNGTAMTSGASIMGPGTGWSIARTADFDGDGKADLLWSHTDGRVAIWLMNGLAVKATNQILNAGSGWGVTHTPDLNGDGKADIVWQHTDGRVALWLMNGGAMSAGSGVLGAGTGWAVTRTGDFNGDGKDDLLFLHADGRAAIYLMNGLSPATTAQILNAGGGWSAKRTADLDGDGKADIVWENVNGSTAVWLMSGTTMASGAQLTGPATGWTVSGVSP